MPTQDVLLELLQSFPPEIATILLAALPVMELRGALPLALVVYRLPVVTALVLSVIGNMLPVYFLLVFFERFSVWIRRHSALADSALQWLFARTRRKLDGSVQKYGYWALALFVAVPLPATGAWSGALAAFVFGLPKRQSFYAILVGVCLAAIIVTIATLGTTFTVRAFL